MKARTKYFIVLSVLLALVGGSTVRGFRGRPVIVLENESSEEIENISPDE